MRDGFRGGREWIIGLYRVEFSGDVDEQGLVRTGAGQMDAHPAAVAHDDGADFQELETDCAVLGAGHIGALEPQPADGLEQRIGEALEQQAELIGSPLENH